MAEALAEAEKSLHVGRVPVGAVVVLDDEVVARAHWVGASQLRLLDHPELVALLEAERCGRVARRRERQEAVLYTTLEPCALCMAAAMSFLLGKIVYAAEAPIDGGTNLPRLWKPALGHPANAMPYAIPEVVGGCGARRERCADRGVGAATARSPVGSTLRPKLDRRDSLAAFAVRLES